MPKTSKVQTPAVMPRYFLDAAVAVHAKHHWFSCHALSTRRHPGHWSVQTPEVTAFNDLFGSQNDPFDNLFRRYFREEVPFSGPLNQDQNRQVREMRVLALCLAYAMYSSP